MRRATVVVLDACGVGELPDAAAYGDAGSNTLVHLAEQVGGLRLPTLARLGLGSIVPIPGVAPASDPAVYGRLRPLGPGKESTTGHWELMGVVPGARAADVPARVPARGGAALEDATGMRFCCNRPYSGTEVIEAYGAHHLETGEAILYTSADSVLQIAAHVDRVSEPELYAACEAARRVMTGENAVGRVIARPFEGSPGAFAAARAGATTRCGRPAARTWRSSRTPARRCTASARSTTCSPASGSTSSTPARPTPAGIAATTRLLRELESGLIFVNLVETDQVYGHRHDVEGFHQR